jgi:hypothetical protein
MGGTVPQQPNRQNSQQAHGQRKSYAIYSHILIIGGNYSDTLTFCIHHWFELLLQRGHLYWEARHEDDGQGVVSLVA